ncbi:hypothetical protein SASPL_132545 [Salvia splendens]|uniref:Uncharacterized protein n=1 Tax=Salvia splendens TaxID=180675 RepID=A0A8X8ZHG3_SALSN|nr:hypothetical protein SASPL_132545 [Salvia splendens]
MAPRKSESGASSWLEVGSGGDGEANEAAVGAVSAESEERRQEPAEEAPPEEKPPQEEEAAAADPSIFQLLYPRPRMRWTVELHDQFVKAVDELGGANSNFYFFFLSLTFCLVIRKKDWDNSLPPKEPFAVERRDMVPPMNQPQGDEPSVQSAFNMNGTNVLGDEALSYLHLMVEDVVEPPLLPLFPAGGPTMEWPEFNQGGARRALENPPTMDEYLNYSADFTNPSCTLFNTFFDDVATLPTPNPDFFTAPPTFP